MAMKYGASAPPMAGFFIPPQVLTRDDFKKAAGIFISPDGHAARYLVQTKLNPFSIAAMDQVNSVLNTARQAQPNTTLADAKVSMAGISVGLRDTRDYYNKDFNFIIVTTVVIVFLILIGLLRAIVAPLYLICSVIVSYLSALGIGTIMFQFILGQELHWTVPGLTFIILVAVGADYNLLLISRIRDESPHGVRVGVIRTVGSTGGVITAAGLIFAASMFGLLFASISMMVQAGFVLGMGILLDTFLVRTVTVPAIATLVGRANWWPSRPQQHKSDGVGMRSHLAKIRKAMTPKFATRRRLVTPPTADGPEPTQDDQMTSNGTEPSHPNGERPLETCDQRPAEREPVLAVTPAWRAGRMLHR
jgi:RND superfamily putative drug exporter